MPSSRMSATLILAPVLRDQLPTARCWRGAPLRERDGIASFSRGEGPRIRDQVDRKGGAAAWDVVAARTLAKAASFATRDLARPGRLGPERVHGAADVGVAATVEIVDGVVTVAGFWLVFADQYTSGLPWTSRRSSGKSSRIAFQSTVGSGLRVDPRQRAFQRRLERRAQRLVVDATATISRLNVAVSNRRIGFGIPRASLGNNAVASA